MTEKLEGAAKRETELVANIDAMEGKVRELGIENGKLAASLTDVESALAQANEKI